jgi:hypothetical protein
MARARWSGGHEGIASAVVTDLSKRVCQYCGGTRFMIKDDCDDINDSHHHSEASAYYITATGGVISGRIYLCDQCGQENVEIMMILDTCAGVAGAAITMTNLDASTANGLAGCYVIPLGGTDARKKFTISSNTAAAPTVITLSVAPNADTNGEVCLVTSINTEYTAAS